MGTSRFFAGVFQVFISIFAPVWCVTHAPEDKKTSWITSLMVATPGGIVAGYLLSALILACKASWAISFYLQVVLLVPVAIYIAYINKTLLVLEIKEIVHEVEVLDETKLSKSNQKQRIYHKLYLDKMSIEAEKTVNYNFWQNVCYLLKRTDFTSILVTLVMLFLVISGL